jgi:hypothetical protein
LNIGLELEKDEVSDLEDMLGSVFVSLFLHVELGMRDMLLDQLIHDTTLINPVRQLLHTYHI